MNANVDVRNKLAKFLACELDCNSGHLSVAGEPQKLEPMVHQFLLLLIQHQGNIVSKQRVLDTLWANKKPTDETLRALIKKAREALKDNARNPSYIKTIPTKGYLLIPVVELNSTVIQSWFLQHTKLLIGTVLTVSILIFLLVWYFYSSGHIDERNNKVVITKTNLGSVNKNKVSTHYINGVIKNIWVEEVEANSTSQIRMFDIATKFEQKIVFSTSLIKQLWYSRGSQRLLVMRNDRKGFYSVQFGRQTSEQSIIEYKVTLPIETTIRALDYNGNHIFVVPSVSQKLALVNLETGVEVEKPAITNIHKQLEIAQSEFFEIERQNVFVNAWPSPAVNGLVVSFDFGDKTRLLYYPTINATKPISVVDFTGGLQSAVWNKDGQRFSFSDDNSRLFAFQVDEGKLTSFNANGEPVNQVVADCGSTCFVVANTQGIPKLSEFSNPFIDADKYKGSNESLRPYAQIISTNSIARNEYLPLYTTQGLYFVSQQFGKTAIVFRDNNHHERVLFAFGMQATVEELTVDNNDNYLAGMVNQRLFLLDLNSQELNYIPLTFPHVSQVAFASNNMLRFYAETTALKGTMSNPLVGSSQNKAQTNAGQANGLYQYNMDTRQVTLLSSNVKVQHSIELLEQTEKGSSRYKATLSLNNNEQVTVTFQNNRPATIIDIGAYDCASCWRIKGSYLYQIRSNSNDRPSSILSRVNLLTGEQTQQSLLFTDSLNTFSIHPKSNKIVVITRQNLQTQLTKIEGFAQVY